MTTAIETTTTIGQDIDALIHRVKLSLADLVLMREAMNRWQDERGNAWE